MQDNITIVKLRKAKTVTIPAGGWMLIGTPDEPLTQHIAKRSELVRNDLVNDDYEKLIIGRIQSTQTQSRFITADQRKVGVTSRGETDTALENSHSDALERQKRQLEDAYATQQAGHEAHVAELNELHDGIRNQDGTGDRPAPFEQESQMPENQPGTDEVLKSIATAAGGTEYALRPRDENAVPAESNTRTTRAQARAAGANKAAASTNQGSSNEFNRANLESKSEDELRTIAVQLTGQHRLASVPVGGKEQLIAAILATPSKVISPNPGPGLATKVALILSMLWLAVSATAANYLPVQGIYIDGSTNNISVGGTNTPVGLLLPAQANYFNLTGVNGSQLNTNLWPKLGVTLGRDEGDPGRILLLQETGNGASGLTTSVVYYWAASADSIHWVTNPCPVIQVATGVGVPFYTSYTNVDIGSFPFLTLYCVTNANATLLVSNHVVMSASKPLQ